MKLEEILDYFDEIHAKGDDFVLPEFVVPNTIADNGDNGDIQEVTEDAESGWPEVSDDDGGKSGDFNASAHGHNFEKYGREYDE